jgi:hypothetical protein
MGLNACSRFEGLLVVALKEKTALVTKDARLDDENVGNGGGRNFQD